MLRRAFKRGSGGFAVWSALVGSPYAKESHPQERIAGGIVIKATGSKQASYPILASIFIYGVLTLAQEPGFALSGVTLEWDPIPEPVAGYKIDYGPASGSYSNEVFFGDVTNATITDLVEGATYFFVVKSFRSSGEESLPERNILHGPRQWRKPGANHLANQRSSHVSECRHGADPVHH